MDAVITVVGKDRIGILALMANVCADNKINILDVSQTIVDDIFTMTMIVDTKLMEKNIKEFSDDMKTLGEKEGLVIRMMNREIFDSMHRI